MVLLAIHDRPGSFSERWFSYCVEHGIPHKLVNCQATDIVAQLDGASALLWHWAFHESSSLVARSIIASLERKGLIVFPNLNTCWHYDDKVGQKFLLEAMGAPLIPTWVFTNRKDAIGWIQNATWPKVFKLRCGAGSTNVRLVRSRSQALALCNRAFGRGFRASGGYLTDMQTRLRKTRTSAQFWEKVRRAPRVIWSNLVLRRQTPRQRGYLYFQDFMPNNNFDTRITIIGDRAFGFMRANRPRDFRASGSGLIDYNAERIDQRCVQTAFRIADRLGSQSLAFDFLFDRRHEPVITEVSYAYVPSPVYACEGYWDHRGRWHGGHIWPQDAILEDVLESVEQRHSRECVLEAAPPLGRP